MKILVLDEEFPWPLNTGKRIRSFNLLCRFAGRHDLHYLAFGDENSESFAALQGARMNPIAVEGGPSEKSGIGFYFKLLINLLDDRPYIVSSHYSRLFQETLDRLVIEMKPDIIICEWTPYAAYVNEHQRCRKIIVAHNIESTIWQRYHENESNPLKKWYIGRQYHKVLRFERDAFKRVDGFTAVSQSEADRLKAMAPQTANEVVDNGVDLEYFDSSEKQQSSNELVFTGSMDWRPNQDAACYFVEEIYPLLRREIPDITATFVGRNPPAHIKHLGEIDGITITGTVDDVRPYVDRAAIYIVPLRIGGGSRLKILEALAMKKPVVSTTVGAEGLETKDGHDIILADSPEEFKKEILRLLSDRTLGSTLGNNGRRLVEQRYGWDSLSRTLENFIQSLVEMQ